MRETEIFWTRGREERRGRRWQVKTGYGCAPTGSEQRSRVWWETEMEMETETCDLTRNMKEGETMKTATLELELELELERKKRENASGGSENERRSCAGEEDDGEVSQPSISGQLST